MAVHDPRFVERWPAIIADWRSSGLSVTAICRSRQVCKSGFHLWRTILQQLDHNSAIPPRPVPEPQPARSFVPVRVVPVTFVEVILPSGLQLRVPLSADAPQVARLVLALGGTPC